MPTVESARSGAKFLGDDGRERVVLQIGSGEWPAATELTLVATRELPARAGEPSALEEEVYQSPRGLKLWARRC
jgi:hypothetical protein